MKVRRWATITVALLALNEVSAQTVYKSVDEKGNVSYSENPPSKAGKGGVKSTTELTLDPNKNVIPAVPITEGSSARGAADEGDRAAAPAVDRGAEARAALEQAEALLKAGSAVQPGDFIGRANGGVGPSPQRLERLQELQRAVDEARERYEQSQGR